MATASSGGRRPRRPPLRHRPLATAFADTLHRVIARLDAAGVCGWIVDLRGNTGGNMWPMLAGLGPLLGPGTAGYFAGPDGRRDEWGYRDGASLLAGQPMVRVGAAPVRLRTPDPPVAVLTGPSTLSSGEAMAVAFRARVRTRSFGSPTGGRSTSNRTITLPDGAVMAITNAHLADRTGRTYGDPVAPDVPIATPTPGQPATADPVARAARTWLEAGPACHGAPADRPLAHFLPPLFGQTTRALSSDPRRRDAPLPR
jgi:carboxyl-terminal processing protease